MINELFDSSSAVTEQMTILALVLQFWSLDLPFLHFKRRVEINVH